MKPEIVCFTIGGTIASAYDANAGGLLAVRSGRTVLSDIPTLNDICHPRLVEFAAVSSTFLTPKELLEWGRAVDAELAGPAVGAVVVMGTEAMEEAAYLFDLTLKTVKPVAFTGAMSAGAATPADGPRNVVAACRVVLEPALEGYGVLVVMGDEAHAAREAVKTHTTSLATFRSPRAGPVAIVTPDDRVVPIARPTRRDRLPADGIEDRVAYVKCGLGTDGSAVEAAVARGTRGLVIEGFPGGGLPPAVAEAAASAVVAGVVVVVVPRAAAGELTEIYAGVGEGRWLREHGLLFAHGLTGPKARIKLMLALGAHGSEAVPNVFGTE